MGRGQKQLFHHIAEFPYIAAAGPIVISLVVKGLELWSNNAVNSTKRLTREEAEQGVCVGIYSNGDDQGTSWRFCDKHIRERKNER